MIEYRLGPWSSISQEYIGQADLVIGDPIYESDDLSWVKAAADCLRPGGSLWAFQDSSGVAQTKLELDRYLLFQNWCIWPNDWGGRSRDRFGQKHDDVLFYIKPLDKRIKGHTFNGDAVSIPKKMTHQKFNPSGRNTKIPASVWTDLSGFSTTAAERVKLADGKSIRWQKPEKLIERVILASTNPGDLVLDFFGGVATVPVVCARLGRRCVSTEIDPNVHPYGMNRLLEEIKQLTPTLP
jgi:DNA modification methylase